MNGYEQMREELITLRQMFANNEKVYQALYLKYIGNRYFRKTAAKYKKWLYVFQKRREACDAALSEPRRNCDVGSAKEQNARYEHYCFTHRTMERCCQDCPIKDEPCCELAWAQLPYDGEEENAK